jgi:hypothetical protein
MQAIEKEVFGYVRKRAVLGDLYKPATTPIAKKVSSPIEL